MSVGSVRFEDRLDGASNFMPWKTRVTLILKEHDLWENVDKGPSRASKSCRKGNIGEGHKGIEGDTRSCEGSPDLACCRKDKNKGHV